MGGSGVKLVGLVLVVKAMSAMSAKAAQDAETQGSGNPSCHSRPARPPPSTLYSFHPEDRLSPVENVETLDTTRSSMRAGVMEEIAFDFCARVFEASIEETQILLAKAQMERQS